MRPTHRTTRFQSAVAITLLATGCASTTVIRSRPDGARVTRHGAALGITPYTYSDTETVGSEVVLTLDKPGYKPATLRIKREHWNTSRTVLSAVGGLLCLLPFFGLLWAQDYAPEYEVQLEGEGLPSAAPTTPPGQQW